MHALWLRNFISGLGVVDTITKPLKIYCDNSTAVFFSKNDKYSRGTKHMELKYFSVNEDFHKHRVCVEHIRTDLMIADPLTKSLQPKTFKEHVHRMGLCNTLKPRGPVDNPSTNKILEYRISRYHHIVSHSPGSIHAYIF